MNIADFALSFYHRNTFLFNLARSIILFKMWNTTFINCKVEALNMIQGNSMNDLQSEWTLIESLNNNGIKWNLSRFISVGIWFMYSSY